MKVGKYGYKKLRKKCCSFLSNFHLKCAKWNDRIENFRKLSLFVHRWENDSYNILILTCCVLTVLYNEE